MKLPGSEPDFFLSKITRPQWLEQILTVPSSSSQRSSTVRFSKGEVILHCFSYNERCQASTLTHFLTCPFGQLTKKSTCPTQSVSCPKKLLKITKTRE
jgi:hypothetical protein